MILTLSQLDLKMWFFFFFFFTCLCLWRKKQFPKKSFQPHQTLNYYLLFVLQSNDAICESAKPHQKCFFLLFKQHFLNDHQSKEPNHLPTVSWTLFLSFVVFVGPFHHHHICLDQGEPEDQREGVVRDGPGGHRAEDHNHQVLATHKEGQNWPTRAYTQT